MNMFDALEEMAIHNTKLKSNIVRIQAENASLRLELAMIQATKVNEIAEIQQIWEATK